MSGNRREVNRYEITQLIRTKFLSLYAQGGINRVSVGTLCEACGIARSTFYYYYDDKYSVLESIEDELIGTLWNINTNFEWRIEDIQVGQPLDACIQTIQFITEHIDSFKILLGPYGDPQFTYKWKKGLEKHFQECFLAEKGDAVAADIACTIFSSSAIGLFTRYVIDMQHISAHDFAIILGNLLKYCLFDYQMFL